MRERAAIQAASHGDVRPEPLRLARDEQWCVRCGETAGFGDVCQRCGSRQMLPAVVVLRPEEYTIAM